MVNVVMLNVVMLIAIILNVIMLSAIMLNVVMLNVVAPFLGVVRTNGSAYFLAGMLQFHKIL